MARKELPAFPYGAVYFRMSNPPREDWERDYGLAAADGHNIFRHWFLWSAIEVAPGEFDWTDYDRQLDLAAENGIATVIAEMMTSVPEWAFRMLAHARYQRRDHTPVESSISHSCAIGGFPGLCLDNDDARERAGNFLGELVTHYRGHPGLGAYDIWNECGYAEDVCYCPATAERFRAWLRTRYADLKTLGRVWGRHSYSSWDDVVPPRGLAPYADVLDWLAFRQDNAYQLMRWRADLIRGLDPDHRISAHGVASSLMTAASRGTDDWLAAAEVESYGLTWIAARKGSEPWKQFHALDLTRSASRGKDFWHAEAQAGPLWMQPQVIGRPRDDGRIGEPEDIRLWNLTTFCGGARGLLYPRWRPLLDGPLFGAFGPYGMDGSRTPRSEMVSTITKWASAAEQQPLWHARPVRGDIGIVYVPETQLFTYAQQGDAEFFTQATQGAYQAFFASNIQADFVHLDDIDDYEVLYLPFPIMLTEATAARLTAWVEAGGTLLSEGCPAYFSDHAKVGTTQPNRGLDKLFGVVQSNVEFMPDILDDLTVRIDGHTVSAGIFQQSYQPTTGTAIGWYANGEVAAVEHRYGTGRTRLVGSFPSIGYYRHGDQATATYFAQLLRWAGRQQHATTSNAAVIARLQQNSDTRYLWHLNPTRTSHVTTTTLSQQWKPITGLKLHWGDEGSAVLLDGQSLQVQVPARDAVILELI